MIPDELRHAASNDYAEKHLTERQRQLLEEQLNRLRAAPFDYNFMLDLAETKSLVMALLPRLLHTIADMEEALRPRVNDEALREELHTLIVSHSSPTIGRGDVHGGCPGFILYEGGMEFVITRIAAMIQPRDTGVANNARTTPWKEGEGA